jgi:hypothetical protein
LALAKGAVVASPRRRWAREMPVREGDIVVVNTNRVFGNMFDVELVRVFRKVTALGFSSRPWRTCCLRDVAEQSEGIVVH